MRRMDEHDMACTDALGNVAEKDLQELLEARKRRRLDENNGLRLNVISDECEFDENTEEEDVETQREVISARHAQDIKKVQMKRTAFNKRVNYAIHCLAVRTMYVWAQVNNCAHLLPPNLISQYMSIRYTKEFTTTSRKGTDGQQHSPFETEALLKCIKSSKDDLEEVQALVVQLVEKNPQCELKTDYITPAKKSVVKAGLVGAALQITAATAEKLAARDATQTRMSSFLLSSSDELELPQPSNDAEYDTNNTSFDMSDADRELLAGDGSPEVSEKAGARVSSNGGNGPRKLRSLLHITPAVSSYDELMKILIRGHGWSKNEAKDMYIAVDTVCSKLATVTARLKFLSFLLRAEMECMDENAAVEAFLSDQSCQQLVCYFAIKHERNLLSNISGDGYCFYRAIYLLYYNHIHGRVNSLQDLSDIDKNINSSAAHSSDDRSFHAFLDNIATLQRTTFGSETPLLQFEQSAFLEAVRIANFYLHKFPGKGVGQDEWGHGEWIRFLDFPIANFGVVTKKDEYTLSYKRMYTSKCTKEEQWSQLVGASVCPPDANTQNITLGQVQDIMKHCSFLTFQNNHFFLIPNLDEENAAVAYKKMCLKMLQKLRENVRLVDDVQAVRENVELILNSIETDKDCAVPPLQLESFKAKYKTQNPSAPSVNVTRTILELDGDGEQDEKSLVETLKAQVNCHILIFLVLSTVKREFTQYVVGKTFRNATEKLQKIVLGREGGD
jgi:hypothetical protein